MEKSCAGVGRIYLQCGFKKFRGFPQLITIRTKAFGSHFRDSRADQKIQIFRIKCARAAKGFCCWPVLSLFQESDSVIIPASRLMVEAQ